MTQPVQRPRGPRGCSPRYAHLPWPADVTPEQIERWQAEHDRTPPPTETASEYRCENCERLRRLIETLQKP